MKKRKGFTLIELLAVIVILAIIALISTPVILNVIEDSREKANKNSVYGLIHAAELYYAENMVDGNISFDENGNKDILNELKVSGKKPKSGFVKINDKGQIAVGTIYDDTCYVKDFDSDKVKQGDLSNCEYVTPPNKPVLYDNMVAIEINESGIITVANISNNSWYNYDLKKWANAVVLNDGSKPSVGSTIPLEDIKQMYVWIPRYKYSDITEVNKPFNIKFISKTEKGHTAFSLLNSDDTYSEISGIWVGKFEIASDYKIVPNVNSLYGATLKTINTGITNNIKPDIGEELHMIKNTEWGAISYFTHSKYGICNENSCNTKVQNNNYIDSTLTIMTTGCGGDDTKVTGVCPDENKWTSTNGKGASTTHNITGIYDMAGGRGEYVLSGMYGSTDEQTRKIDTAMSNFTDQDIEKMSPSTIDKYNYGSSTRDISRQIPGDATGPTAGWDDDLRNFVSNSNSWFSRGGSMTGGVTSGIWSYDMEAGNGNNYLTSRVTIFGK